MSEQQKILEMIEKGQITAAEGMELLEALNMTEVTPLQAVETAKQSYKFFRVRVTSDNNSVNVNVNIPIRLLTTIGEIADRMTTMVPPDARKEMESKGIDISSVDFAKIVEEVINGTLEEPNIVDVDAWDESSQSMIKVRVYVD
ncbi:SHOCT-like domain-containing protein [Acetobacterium carbinolicum]|uniref:SHOCT-like domain-containing protein n=1 Tax=Acetobacterium carbinolicum TaxID=52690 RepID=UPI0039C945C1